MRDKTKKNEKGIHVAYMIKKKKKSEKRDTAKVERNEGGGIGQTGALWLPVTHGAG